MLQVMAKTDMHHFLDIYMISTSATTASTPTTTLFLPGATYPEAVHHYRDLTTLGTNDPGAAVMHIP